MPIILAVLALVALASAAVADELPKGFGHPNGPTHWYPSQCCSMRDCEPVPYEAATQDINGNWVVHYRTSRGFDAYGLIRADDVRMSNDGFVHACALPPSDGSYPFGTPSAVGRVICLFIVPTT